MGQFKKTAAYKVIKLSKSGTQIALIKIFRVMDFANQKAAKKAAYEHKASYGNHNRKQLEAQRQIVEVQSVKEE